MEFLQDVLNNVKDFVVPKPKQRTWDFADGGVGLTLSETLLPQGVGETGGTPVSPLLYESDEQANRTFLHKYWLYMTNHYGRAPEHRSDLFCCMMPMDVMNPEIDRDFPVRYWWMSLKHPLVHILHNNGADAEQELDSVVFGICLVYRDEYVEQVMDWLVELCEQEGKVLNLESKSAFAKDRDRVRPLVLEEDEAEEPAALAPQAPPSIILNGTNSFVGSKKDD